MESTYYILIKGLATILSFFMMYKVIFQKKLINQTKYNIVWNMKDMLMNCLNKIVSRDLGKGFFSDFEKNEYVCIFCGMRFEEGVVYPVEEKLYTGERAAVEHVKSVHGDVFSLLLDLGKELTGISGIQEKVLRAAYEGKNDRQIALEIGGKAESTIRNHRYHLNRKFREAKLFCAVMELLENRGNAGPQFLEFHPDIPASDERIIITREEADAVRKKYFNSESGLLLLRFPKKQKEKLVVLKTISELFQWERTYTAGEVNTIIAAVHEEYVTIRRYLIDYRFLERKADGSKYWRHA